MVPRRNNGDGVRFYQNKMATMCLILEEEEVTWPPGEVLKSYKLVHIQPTNIPRREKIACLILYWQAGWK